MIPDIEPATITPNRTDAKHRAGRKATHPHSSVVSGPGIGGLDGTEHRFRTRTRFPHIGVKQVLRHHDHLQKNKRDYQ